MTTTTKTKIYLGCDSIEISLVYIMLTDMFIPYLLACLHHVYAMYEDMFPPYLKICLNFVTDTVPTFFFLPAAISVPIGQKNFNINSHSAWKLKGNNFKL